MPTSVRRDATLSLSRGAKSLFIVFILQCFCAVKIIFILLRVQRAARAKLPAYWVAKANMLPVHLAARAELRAHRVGQANTLPAHRRNERPELSS